MAMATHSGWAVEEVGSGVHFQAALAAWRGPVAELFFELANAPAVRFAVPGGRGEVSVVQDPTVADCTGGVVWETALMMAQLLCRDPGLLGSRRPRVLELGAGCGLLGVALARAGCDVLLTEAAPAMGNLRRNVAGRRGAAAAELHWGEAPPGGVDAVVGTDVVFSAALVRPMLETARAALPPGGALWLCLQRRCEAAHGALLAAAPTLFEGVSDETARLHADPTVGPAARELECLLLRLQR